MRPPRYLLVLFSMAFGLAPSLALAQSPPAAPAAQKAPPAPAKAPAAPAPAAGAPGAGAASAPPAARKRPGRARKPKKADDLTGRPVATFPGFRMLPTGGSRVFVQIHGGKVDVAESKAPGRLVYRMKGAGAIQTNRFPLVTAFFATPVAQVQLVDQGNDLDMVIDLRAQAEATYRVIDTDQGVVIQVDFPPFVPDQGAAAQPEGARQRAVRRTIPQQPGSSDEGSPEL
ncbi:AMIN domain-containing protein [Sorangium sp. So ce1024]|uniref:AMIN domain-containing protein n=1 Tax=unclassified Sorangium TaxID=2621164 RepID=UPI003EFDE985